MFILYLGSSLERHISSSWYYLLKKLDEKVELVQYGPSRPLSSNPFLRYPIFSEIPVLTNIYSKLNMFMRSYSHTKKIEMDVKKIVKKLDPDYILLEGFFPPRVNWKNLDKVKIPKAIVISDPHLDFKNKLEYVMKNKIDLALFVCKFSMKNPLVKRLVEKEKIDCKYLPWSVDIDVFKDYKLPYKNDVISSGAISKKFYPFRYEIRKRLSKIPDIKFCMPEHAILDLRRGKPIAKVLIRENYAKFLSQSKIFIFGSGIFNYPLMKYFEGMACNTLVMAPMPKDGKDLHFIPDKNFIEINRRNYLEKIRYYLKHEDERRQIALFGMETIKKYHTVQIRTNELIEYLNGVRE